MYKNSSSRIQLSDHFTNGRILRFVLPSIVMMVFTSIYGVVDGLFVSRFAGKVQFTAVNLIMPLLMIVGAIGFMMGSGGNAIVSRTLGEEDAPRANRYFSLIIYSTLIGGLIIAGIGQLVLHHIAYFFGARGEILRYCVLYGRITLISMPAFMLQNNFQSFFITAEKPKLGLLFTLLAGCTNMFLDLLFVGIFRWGITGAAWATVTSEFVGGFGPMFYFFHRNSSLLHLGKTKFEPHILGRAAFNGSSELMSNIASSIVNILFNRQLLRFAGEDGVAAYGVLMYVMFIFAAIFIGYSVGMAPVIGYNYGSANHKELHNIFVRSLRLIGIFGIAMTVVASLLSTPLSTLFVGYDASLLAMTSRAMKIFSLAFLFSGFNIFGSSFFTALSNGPVSAAISFMRTLVFECGCVLILPEFIGAQGIWFSVVIAELLALALTIFFWIRLQKKYHY